jgi:small subunit ribosomal protein S16
LLYVVRKDIDKMAVKIRLSRIGKKNRPYWRVVAVDSQKKRDGACLEYLGAYDPVTHEILQLHTDQIEKWVSKGAICSPAVIKLIKKNRSTKASAEA